MGLYGGVIYLVLTNTPFIPFARTYPSGNQLILLDGERNAIYFWRNYPSGGRSSLRARSCFQVRWGPYEGTRREVHYSEERKSGPLPERRYGPIGWVYRFPATVNLIVTVAPQIPNFSLLWLLYPGRYYP